MKSSPDPPPAPNPVETTQAQSASNIQTAIANARLNRISQQTPWGSINYTQGPADASGVPSYSSQIQLSPQQQALLEQQQGQQAQRGNLSSSLLNQASGAMSQPLNLQNLHPIYDRYAPGGQATPAISKQPPPPQTPPPQVQQQMPGRDQMLQMLMQFLQSQGQGSQGPANPMARALTSGGSAPVTSPTTGATPQPGGGGLLPANRPLHGRSGIDVGNTLANYGGTGARDPRLAPYVSFGAPDSEQGRQQQINSPAYQALLDRGMVQVPRMDEGDSTPYGVKDPSRVEYDEEFGYVTPSENYRVQDPSLMDDYGPLMMLAPAIAGIAGPALSGMLGGAEAGTTIGAGGALEGAGGVVEGMGAGGSYLTGGAGTGAGLSTAAAQPNWTSQLYNNWSSGRGLLGMNRAGSAPLLAQLLRSMQGGTAK